MKSLVVDTNVGVVANDREADASPDCVIACTDLLQDIVAGQHVVVIDGGWEILAEYHRRMSSSGQPGPGDAFLKWLLQNQANPRRCRVVDLHPRNDRRAYDEFPEDPALEGFDPDDRKFAAVAFAGPPDTPVANAVDSDWWDYREPLERHGLKLLFVCADQVAAWESTR